MDGAFIICASPAQLGVSHATTSVRRDRWVRRLLCVCLTPSLIIAHALFVPAFPPGYSRNTTM